MKRATRDIALDVWVPISRIMVNSPGYFTWCIKTAIVACSSA